VLRLAWLWQSQDKRSDAYDLLTSVQGWFTEGVETTYVQETKAFLMLLTLARCPGMLKQAMGFVRYMYGESTIEPALVEMVRIKLAWNNQCWH
jgi:hypothetical protein